MLARNSFKLLSWRAGRYGSDRSQAFTVQFSLPVSHFGQTPLSLLVFLCRRLLSCTLMARKQQLQMRRGRQQRQSKRLQQLHGIPQRWPRWPFGRVLLSAKRPLAPPSQGLACHPGWDLLLCSLQSQQILPHAQMWMISRYVPREPLSCQSAACTRHPQGHQKCCLLCLAFSPTMSNACGFKGYERWVPVECRGPQAGCACLQFDMHSDRDEAYSSFSGSDVEDGEDASLTASFWLPHIGSTVDVQPCQPGPSDAGEVHPLPPQNGALHVRISQC